MQLQLHAPGAQGLEHHGRVFRAEEEGRIGRPLLHHLQQHVLVLLRQQGTVRKRIDLPPPFVGADVGVRPDGAHHVHGDVLVVRVPDGDHVRMDARQHLPAGGADAAGAAPLPRALQSGGGKADGGHPVTAAGEQQGVGQGAAGGGLPDADGGGLLRPQAEQGHGVLSFSRCERGLICRFSGGAGRRRVFGAPGGLPAGALVPLYHTAPEKERT